MWCTRTRTIVSIPYRYSINVTGITNSSKVNSVSIPYRYSINVTYHDIYLTLKSVSIPYRYSINPVSAPTISQS